MGIVEQHRDRGWKWQFCANDGVFLSILERSKYGY
jgi:hypothetical protein